MSHLTAWTFTAQSLRGSMGQFATAHLVVFPQLETRARFVFGQPSRDSDLSPGNVTQPCAVSQLQAHHPGWLDSGVRRGLSRTYSLEVSSSSGGQLSFLYLQPKLRPLALLEIISFCRNPLPHLLLWLFPGAGRHNKALRQPLPIHAAFPMPLDVQCFLPVSAIPTTARPNL